MNLGGNTVQGSRLPACKVAQAESTPRDLPL